MMMALPLSQTETGRGLLIIKTPVVIELAVLLLHVIHRGITTGNVMPISQQYMQLLLLLQMFTLKQHCRNSCESTLHNLQ